MIFAACLEQDDTCRCIQAIHAQPMQDKFLIKITAYLCILEYLNQLSMPPLIVAPRVFIMANYKNIGTGTDMNGTRQSFQKLTESLLNQLANETLRKCIFEMTSKMQVAIDILVRNSFERTADIGFLATDNDIYSVFKEADSFKNHHSRKQSLEVHLPQLQNRVFEYLPQYSVYSESLEELL